MTLADLTLPVTYEWGVKHALVFDAVLASRLAEVQASHGDPRHAPNPVALSDGRFMLTADILTECQQGGLVHGGFSQLDAARFGEIEVVLVENAVSMIAAPS